MGFKNPGTGGISQTGNVLIPVESYTESTVAAQAANVYRGYRMIVPKAGTISDVAIWVGTQSGNVEAVILDDTAVTRNRLWSSGVIACPSASASAGDWKSLGNPALVVFAGQHIDIALGTSDAVATFGRFLIGGITTNATRLPSGYLVSQNGALPLKAWTITLGALGFPASQAESGLGIASSGAAIIARIT